MVFNQQTNNQWRELRAAYKASENENKKLRRQETNRHRTLQNFLTFKYSRLKNGSSAATAGCHDGVLGCWSNGEQGDGHRFNTPLFQKASSAGINQGDGKTTYNNSLV